MSTTKTSKRNVLNLSGGDGNQQHFFTNVTTEGVNSVSFGARLCNKFEQVDFVNVNESYDGEVIDVIKTINNIKDTSETTAESLGELVSNFSTLQTDLSKAITTRETNFTEVKNLINDEAANRAAAIAGATRLIADEIIAREVFIDAEKKYRINGDKTLSDKIGEFKTSQNNFISNYRRDIAQIDVGGLSSKIEAETVERKLEVADVTGLIADEAANRAAAIDSLCSTLSSNISAVNKKLKSNIQDLVDRATTFTSSLNTLNNKISSADHILNALTKKISPELDSLVEFAENYNNLNTDTLEKVDNNRDDIDYLLKVVGILLKKIDGTSGHESTYHVGIIPPHSGVFYPGYTPSSSSNYNND